MREPSSGRGAAWQRCSERLAICRGEWRLSSSGAGGRTAARRVSSVWRRGSDWATLCSVARRTVGVISFGGGAPAANSIIAKAGVAAVNGRNGGAQGFYFQNRFSRGGHRAPPGASFTLPRQKSKLNLSFSRRHTAWYL